MGAVPQRIDGRTVELVPSNSRKLLIPREHGSWGLWILPLLSGAVVGMSSPRAAWTPLLWFCLVSTCAFLINQPLESLLGFSLFKIRTQHERHAVTTWIASFGTLAAAGGVGLVIGGRSWIILLLPLAVAAFMIRARFGFARSKRMAKELTGSVVLTSTAAGAYYASTGTLDQRALTLWLACTIFAIGQIEYVQLRLRMAGPKSRKQKVVAGLRILAWYMAIMIGAIEFAPVLAPLAFIPAISRLVVWMAGPPQPLRVHRLGWTELVQNVVFAVLITVAYVGK